MQSLQPFQPIYQNISIKPYQTFPLFQTYATNETNATNTTNATNATNPIILTYPTNLPNPTNLTYSTNLTYPTIIIIYLYSMLAIQIMYIIKHEFYIIIILGN